MNMKELILLVVSTLAFMLANAQQASTDRLVDVRHFLQIVYPEIEWSKGSLCIEDRDGADNYVLHDFSVFSAQGACFQSAKDPINGKGAPYRATFGYNNQYGRMVDFMSNAYARQNDQMKADIEAHQEWSDIDVANALKQAGFLYGPNDKEAFLKSVQLDRLQEFIGTFETNSVYFVSREWLPVEDGSTRFVSRRVAWAIDGNCTLPTGKKSYCWLIFEAYRGRLIGFYN